MILENIDKSGLIRESYQIEGITDGECRSIFLDWAIKLPAEYDTKAAISALLQHYGDRNAEHPMTQVLTDGLQSAKQTGRRGGRAARLQSD